MTEDEHEALPWCHVYPQYIWHSSATIEGTRASLLAIRSAIDTALATGMDAESEQLFAADGEGYVVIVKVRNLKYLEDRTLPYSAHFAGGLGTKAYEDGVKDDKQIRRQIRESRRRTKANGQGAIEP